jgi:hypothetical protein
MALLMIPLAVGCVGGGEEKPTADADDTGEPAGTDEAGDGVMLEDGDCDDTDPTIYPDANEILDDGIDQDCNGHDAITCHGDYVYADAEHCAVITGDLTAENTAAVDLALLHTPQEIHGRLVIFANDALASVTIASLTGIGGDIEITSNPVLSSFSLDNFTDASGDLNIHDNPALRSIALASLTDIGGHVNIEYNDALTSLSLDSLTTVAGVLRICSNAALCQSLVDDLVAALEAHGWSGSSDIDGNADC